MKCILWSEKIYKNTWDEQYDIVILQLYLLINLLNHRMNIMLHERLFNFTASLGGNVAVNRTGTFRKLSPRLFLPRGSGKGSPFTALQKNEANSINKPGKFTSHDLSSFVGCFFALFLGTHIWVLISLYSVSNRPKVVN